MLQRWVRVELDASPEGRAEDWLQVISRSFGTCPVRTDNPTLKRWAIVTISLREKGFALLWRPKILVALPGDGRAPVAVSRCALRANGPKEFDLGKGAALPYPFLTS